MILSIIIPMYKVEAFIEKCLNSCLNQDISKEEYEIVCVNDGSPDKSAEIAEHIAKSNANIRVINRPNGGLSAARNTGIDNAKGEYIFFVDSDDWIADNCLGKITSILKEEKPDGIAICAANWIQGKAIRRNSFSEKNFKSGVEMLHRKKVQTCAPFTIWKRQFLINYQLKFMNGIFHEIQNLLIEHIIMQTKYLLLIKSVI